MPTRIVALAALGYFVDILDLFLFSVLRIPSLRGLGIDDSQMVSYGVWLLNWQMAGMLLGSLFWGIRGDRLGRIGALYGSILLYSGATLANAFVAGIGGYTVCRFLAGVGLAGELGAAITLVSESLSTKRRGIGTTFVAGIGLCGGTAAAWMGELLPWKTCYVIGGSLGLLLFFLRLRLNETALFTELKKAPEIPRGSLRLLLSSPHRLWFALSLVLTGLPIYFVAGVLMVFAPELARAMAIEGEVTAGKAVFYSYIGVAVGDFLCGMLSQIWQSRKKPLALFLGYAAITVAWYLNAERRTAGEFYQICFFAGTATGYWVVLLTTAAEHFGTNLRTTLATTIPCFIRASVIPMTFAFQNLLAKMPLRNAAAWVGGVVFVLAAVGFGSLNETFHRDLDFVER